MNFEKKPAVFAAEKIVAGETTIEKSAKKKYISACESPSHSKSKNKPSYLIKFPIKQQAFVTKMEKICFEQNLDPIIKLPDQYKKSPSKSPKKELAQSYCGRRGD